MRAVVTLETFARDTRYAVRGLRRSPLFTLVAVLTLAIGIGATTAVFSVVDGVLLKPLPYPDPERLVAVWHDAPGAGGLAGVDEGLRLSPSMMVTYRDQGRSFEKIGLWGPIVASVTGLGEPEQLPAAIVTGQLLPAFGVPPLLGRWIAESDETLDAPPVTVLSYGYWQRRFGGDRNVIGKSITINGLSAADRRRDAEGLPARRRGRRHHRRLPLRPLEAGAAAVLRHRHRASEARRHDRAGERRHGAPAAGLDRLVPVPGRRQRQGRLPRYLEDRARAPAA